MSFTESTLLISIWICFYRPYAMTALHRSDFIPIRDLFTELDLFYQIMRGFYKTFAMSVACRQGTLTYPDTWSRPIWDLHMFYLFRPILFPNLSLFSKTILFEHPSILSLHYSTEGFVMYSEFSMVNIPPRYQEVSLNMLIRTMRFDFDNLDIKSLSKQKQICHTFVSIGIPFIYWYTMPSNRTYMFSTRTVKASND